MPVSWDHCTLTIIFVFNGMDKPKPVTSRGTAGYSFSLKLCGTYCPNTVQCRNLVKHGIITKHWTNN